MLTAPVWAGRMATPLRVYLQRFSGRFRRVAFVTTRSGEMSRRAFADFAAQTGQTGIARLALSDTNRQQHHDTKKLTDFVAAPKAPPDPS